MWKSKKEEKLSPSMAVIMGIVVTVEIMIAGGMILNIDFRSVDVIALCGNSGNYDSRRNDSEY